MKSNLSRIKFLLIFCALAISIAAEWQRTVIAQENANSHSVSTLRAKVTFNPPAGDKPKTSHAGASRGIGQCINQAENSDLPLSPLLPVSEQALTVASHPTVLAYLPQTSAQKVLFSWQDESNNEHYQAILPLNNQGAVISLTLPADAPPLEVGKNYNWALAILCDGQLRPDTPTIKGQIRRVALESTIRDRLSNANPLETAIIYGEAGIWYETVASLAQLKASAPGDRNLTSNWEDLLTSVGLEKLAQAPTTQD